MVIPINFLDKLDEAGMIKTGLNVRILVQLFILLEKCAFLMCHYSENYAYFW